LKVDDDECVTAHETYKCGKDNAPQIVNKILTKKQGNSTIVIKSSKKFVILQLNIFSYPHQCRVLENLEIALIVEHTQNVWSM
jgi:hypothetical protein